MVQLYQKILVLFFSYKCIQKDAHQKKKKKNKWEFFFLWAGFFGTLLVWQEEWFFKNSVSPETLESCHRIFLEKIKRFA